MINPGQCIRKLCGMTKPHKACINKLLYDNTSFWVSQIGLNGLRNGSYHSGLILAWDSFAHEKIRTIFTLWVLLAAYLILGILWSYDWRI